MQMFKDTTRAVINGLRIVHEDEQGADALEKLLIIAAIVLPLLIVLIFLRGKLAEWVQDIWDTMRGKADEELVN